MAYKRNDEKLISIMLEKLDMPELFLEDLDLWFIFFDIWKDVKSNGFGYEYQSLDYSELKAYCEFKEILLDSEEVDILRGMISVANAEKLNLITKKGD